MTLPDKTRVRDSFERAANGYDAVAVLQRLVCDRLLDAAAALGKPQSLLDAGCGTGYGARMVRARWPATRITGVDFAPSMLTQASPFLDVGQLADIESLPFSDNSFEAWLSSLAIQWCDLDRVSHEAMRVLSPGGWMALSTLGASTFHELREAFASVDNHRHTLDFSGPDALLEAATAAGFSDIRIHRETLSLHYPDLRTLLGAVKGIGANALGSGRRIGMMGKAAWREVNAAYERHRTADGLPASYDVILLTARKP